MKKLLLTTVLFGASTVTFAAQEVARVISSTPVMQQVGVPRQACATYSTPGVPPQCSTQTIYENRVVAYDVIYEYAGKQYSVQMPQDPGPTLRLQVAGVEAPGQPLPVIAGGTMAAPVPVSGSQTTVVVEAPYPYPGYPAYPGYVAYGAPGYVSYYGSPYGAYLGPVVSLGFVGGYYGGRHFGGWGHGHRR